MRFFSLTVFRERFRDTLNAFESKKPQGFSAPSAQVKELAGHYEWAAKWLNDFADNEEIDDHVDVFFVERDQVASVTSNRPDLP